MMHEQGRRLTDQKARNVSEREAEPEPTEFDREACATAFPVFADAPFLTWYHRHLKYDLCRQLHPSATPVILLWDESEEDLLLELSH
jgi:hypothetical protein